MIAPDLVVTDLDGTFLSPDGTASATNIEAVRRWVASGRRFLVATGRPPRWLHPLDPIVDLGPLVIASNGAVVYDCARQETILTHPLDPEILVTVMAEIRAAIPTVSYGLEHGFSFVHEENYVIAENVPDSAAAVTVGRVEDHVDTPAVKLLVKSMRHNADDLAALVSPIVDQRLTVTHSAANGMGLLEVSAPGITKARTLAEMCHQWRIDPTAVAAFGDMPNDGAMLEWAGQAFVMANAHPTMVAMGTLIGSNSDSAVGQTMINWLDQLPTSEISTPISNEPPSSDTTGRQDR